MFFCAAFPARIQSVFRDFSVQLKKTLQKNGQFRKKCYNRCFRVFVLEFCDKNYAKTPTITLKRAIFGSCNGCTILSDISEVENTNFCPFFPETF